MPDTENCPHWMPWGNCCQVPAWAMCLSEKIQEEFREAWTKKARGLPYVVESGCEAGAVFADTAKFDTQEKAFELAVVMAHQAKTIWFQLGCPKIDEPALTFSPDGKSMTWQFRVLEEVKATSFEPPEKKPGRELDREIAERVFGRDRMNARVDFDGEPQYHWGYPIGHDYAPRYSTDIAAAWQIVRRARQMGYEVRIAMRDNEHGKSYTAVQFQTSKGEDGAAHSYEGEAHAICLCALRAVERMEGGWGVEEFKPEPASTVEFTGDVAEVAKQALEKMALDTLFGPFLEAGK